MIAAPAHATPGELPTVVALYRASAVSGVCAAGARVAALPTIPWRPMIVGAEVTQAQIAASPLAEAPGLIVTSWPRDATLVEQSLAARDALRRAGATVVVPNDLPQGFIAAGLDHHRGLRCAAWIHADSDDGDELMLRCGELCDAWRTVSRRGRARVQGLGLSLPPASDDVLPACVDVPAQTAPPVLARARLRLLYAGRLEKHHKRILDLAALADQLDCRGVQFTITVAGDGPAEREFRTLAARHISNGSIHLRGPVPIRDMPALYAACDMVVLVSASEGMPTVVMEAMAHARPVAITTGCGGALDIVRNGVTGIIAPTGDMDALASQLCWLTPESIARMGLTARRLALRQFTLPARARACDALIHEAAATPCRITNDHNSQRCHWLSILTALNSPSRREGVGGKG